MTVISAFHVLAGKLSLWNVYAVTMLFHNGFGKRSDSRMFAEIAPVTTAEPNPRSRCFNYYHIRPLSCNFLRMCLASKCLQNTSPVCSIFDNFSRRLILRLRVCDKINLFPNNMCLFISTHIIPICGQKAKNL